MADDTHRLLKTAIEMYGSEEKLARACGVSQAAISKAKGKPVSPNLATRIHRATNGKVPRWELRPDQFNPGDEPPPPIESGQPATSTPRSPAPRAQPKAVARTARPQGEPRITIDSAGDNLYALDVSALVSWEDAIAVSEIVRKYREPR
jgi:DNA-binding transcriptional regulator YdaS (Cro superfamily)